MKISNLSWNIKRLGSCENCEGFLEEGGVCRYFEGDKTVQGVMFKVMFRYTQVD